MERRLWAHEELMATLRLYLQLPFGKLDQKNPEVIRLAQLIGRTPSSVALRLVNYAALDPIQQQRGIKGMANGGKACKEYWDMFMADKDSFLFESEKIMLRLEGKELSDKYMDIINSIPEGVEGKTKERMVKARVNQCVFRTIVMANYNNKCALSGIDIPQLLVASHIVPWAKSSKERLNPSNGICLSSLYDKAFDIGLMTFDDEYRVVYSDKLTMELNHEAYTQFFEPFKEKKLSDPLKYRVNRKFLEWHRDCIFNHF